MFADELSVCVFAVLKSLLKIKSFALKVFKVGYSTWEIKGAQFRKMSQA
jgi:hypothetical protein